MRANDFQKNGFLNVNSPGVSDKYNKFSRRSVEEIKLEMNEVKHKGFVKPEEPKRETFNNFTSSPNFKQRIDNLRNINK